jgi:hypothetical protein
VLEKNLDLSNEGLQAILEEVSPSIHAPKKPKRKSSSTGAFSTK